jgi:hypothetical protein
METLEKIMLRRNGIQCPQNGVKKITSNLRIPHSRIALEKLTVTHIPKKAHLSLAIQNTCHWLIC